MKTLSLQKNGKYWVARWYAAGQQKGKGLGRRSDAGGRVTERAAQVKCRELERRLNLGAVDAEAPMLADYLDAYLANHAELAEGTKRLYRLTGRYLLAHFGKRRLDAITRIEARNWRAALARGELSQRKDAPSESTVCRTCREAKTLFAEAVEDGLIALNPFAKLKTTPPTPAKDWQYIDRPTLRRLLDACPSDSWRLLIALCRLAGLRRNEALSLTWAAVDLDRRRLTANAGITQEDTKHRRREIPIDADLHDLLFACWMKGEKGEKVVSGCRGSYHRGFLAIATKANVPMYSRPYHTLRKCCETDWIREHNIFVVCDWLGHSPAVAQKHYTRAEDRDYDRAAGVETPKQYTYPLTDMG